MLVKSSLTKKSTIYCNVFNKAINFKFTINKSVTLKHISVVNDDDGFKHNHDDDDSLNHDHDVPIEP